jgi:hypothetical protein
MTHAPLRRLARWAIPLVIAVAALTVSACGDDGGAAATEQRGDGSVEDQIGFDAAGIAERQSRVEAAIQQCMAAQGFEYVPVDPLAQRAAITGSTRLSEDEFNQQFGYGISTLFGRGGEQTDPNARIRASLNAADRAAYDRTLWGESTGLTFAQAVDTGDFTELGGCTKQATEEVFGGAATLTALQGKLDELDEQIAADQRMVRANEDWVACMADRGYRFEEPDEIDGDVLERFREVVPGVEAGATAPPDPTVAYDRAALQEVQRYEVEVVRVDIECEEEFIAPVEAVVRPQYETAFREENQALITRLQPG